MINGFKKEDDFVSDRSKIVYNIDLDFISDDERQITDEISNIKIESKNEIKETKTLSDYIDSLISKVLSPLVGK